MEHPLRTPEYGSSVVYHDPVGRAHQALVTAPWGPTCVNLVFVSSDESKVDTYGRQIERQTSCVHKGSTPVHGNYWRWPDEEPNPVKPLPPV
jgi:hypothetical protein